MSATFYLRCVSENAPYFTNGIEFEDHPDGGVVSKRAVGLDQAEIYATIPGWEALQVDDEVAAEIAAADAAAAAARAKVLRPKAIDAAIEPAAETAEPVGETVIDEVNAPVDAVFEPVVEPPVGENMF